MKNIKKFISIFIIFTILFTNGVVFAESVVNVNAQTLLPKAEIFISPASGTFLVGSTFEAPIYINTKGSSINVIDLKINFDPTKLSITNPSGGKSIFDMWIEVPKYDNARGTASFTGSINNGLVTSSGLIVTMTFKVLSSGTTRVSVASDTAAYLNDGLGSEILTNKASALYNLQNKAPNGVNIYSETHPFQDNWYNNNSPVFSWDTNPNVNGFSVLFDTTAQSIPSNQITNNQTAQNYENIKDGIWYFHVRTLAKGVWGATSNFAIRIDTKPPAEFKLTTSSYKDNDGGKKYMISFLTTDTLSGVDHYEVGVINKDNIENSNPIFIETQSPYFVPIKQTEKARVIVRAFDRAGNIQESYVDLYPMFSLLQLVKKFGIYLLLLLLLLLLIELLMHYMFGHHILDHIKRAYRVFKNMSQKENLEELKKDNPENIVEDGSTKTKEETNNLQN